MELELTVADEVQDASMGRPHVVVLGAGASLAAFPSGDSNGRRLPLMDSLIDVLRLGPLLQATDIDGAPENFESLYSKLATDDRHAELLVSIENAVAAYFAEMTMPASPTLYDYLILSLRSKDCIATFNWDPFLWDAWVRVQQKVLSPSRKPPKLLFLHGNVRLGICHEDRRYGLASEKCPACLQDFTRSRLLFPVEHKDYAKDPFVSDQWRCLRRYLQNAYIMTIFGYGAPKSDREAVALMSAAWGRAHERNLEQIEIVDHQGERGACDNLV